MIREAEIKQIELSIEKYCSAMLVDELEFDNPQVKAMHSYRIEALAHSFLVTLCAPAQVLQRDRVLATYPATLWDHIKQKLGWCYKHIEVRLNEHLIFPKVQVPDTRQTRHRLVYVEPRTTFDTYRD